MTLTEDMLEKKEPPKVSPSSSSKAKTSAAPHRNSTVPKRRTYAQGTVNQIQKANPRSTIYMRRPMRSLGSYQIEQTMGQGTFGKVKSGIHSLTGEKVAIKILEKSKIVEAADLRRVRREIQILKKNRHPNIVQLYEVIDTPSAIYLIMEYADRGEMFDYIVSKERLTESEACYFFHQLVDGIDYLHTLGVVHRDLKPENLLLQSLGDKLRIKIIDFGLSNTFETGELLSTACGSPCYAPPEMVLGKEYVGPKADCWSMGVTLFALVCGYLPFEDPSTSKLYKKIVAGQYDLPTTASEELRDLLSKVLNTDPEARYSIAEIRHHPWYNQLEVETRRVLNQSSGAGGFMKEENIDQDVVKEMQKFGFEREIVVSYLLKGIYKSATATYHILVRRKEREQQQHQRQQGQLQASPSSSCVAALNSSAVESVTAAGQIICHEEASSSNEARCVVPKIPIQELQLQSKIVPSLHPLPKQTPTCPNNKGPNKEAKATLAHNTPSYQLQTCSAILRKVTRAAPTSSSNGITRARGHRSQASRPSSTSTAEVIAEKRQGSTTSHPQQQQQQQTQTARLRRKSLDAPPRVMSCNRRPRSSWPHAQKNDCHEENKEQALTEEKVTNNTNNNRRRLSLPLNLGQLDIKAAAFEAVAAAATPSTNFSSCKSFQSATSHSFEAAEISFVQNTEEESKGDFDALVVDVIDLSLEEDHNDDVVEPGSFSETDSLLQDLIPILTSEGADSNSISSSVSGTPRRDSTRIALHNYHPENIRYKSYFSYKSSKVIQQDLQTVLTSMDIKFYVKADHPTCFICSWIGLGFKLQVKTKLPEDLRYIKGTCYRGANEEFRKLCLKVFQQVNPTNVRLYV